ncbi:MAG: Na(+)/H(+) antiporter subunit D, partial [Bryobacteraceae bacterium]
LTLASSGTFLHTGLKLPYYMFFGKEGSRRGQEPPVNMLAAMVLAAAACVLIGVFPTLIYQHLPYPIDYVPYTARHVTATLGLLGFTALGFFSLLKHLDPAPIVSLDTDWFYRRGPSSALALFQSGLVRLESVVARISDFVIERPVLGAAALLREFDARVIDATAVGVGRLTQAASQGLKLAVSGHAQHYGLIMAAGILAAIAVAVFGP